MERTVMAWIGRYLEALGRHAELPLHVSPDEVDEALKTGVVWLRWISVDDDNGAAASRELAFQALELLSLLSHVAYDLWVRAIGSVWPCAMGTWIFACYPRKFELGVSVHATEGGQLLRWSERAFAIDPPLTGDRIEYATLLHALETTLRVYGGTAETTQEIRVRFVLGVEEPGSLLYEDCTTLLLETLKIAKTQAVRRRCRTHTRRPRYRLVVAQGEVFEIHLEVPEVFYLNEIAENGVRISSLFFLDVDFADTPNAARLRHSLTAIANGNQYGQVDTIVIDYHADRQTLDGIFSSLCYSDTVGGIYLDCKHEAELPERGCARLMHWLALCSFGQHGFPCLKKIELLGWNLQLADVDHLERVLHDGNALANLFPEAGQLDDHLHIRVKASKFVLALPDEATVPHVITFDEPLEKLYVISRTEKWISVLLPAWGQAWVQLSDAVLEPVQQIFPTGLRTILPVVELAFNHVSDDDDLYVIIELLWVVGAGVRAIKIDLPEEGVSTSQDWIRSVGMACPSLQEVRFDAIKCEELELLASCYEGGCCSATRLNLDVRGFERSWTAFIKFIGLFADSNHALTQHVRELAIVLRDQQLIVDRAELMDAVKTMLEHNHLLWKFCMTLDGGALGSGVTRDFESVFDGFNGHDVSVRGAPLWIKTKLAFLSVLPLLAEQTSSRYMVDVVVVGRIFEFAAECKKRLVCVTAT